MTGINGWPADWQRRRRIRCCFRFLFCSSFPLTAERGRGAWERGRVSTEEHRKPFCKHVFWQLNGPQTQSVSGLWMLAGGLNVSLLARTLLAHDGHGAIHVTRLDHTRQEKQALRDERLAHKLHAAYSAELAAERQERGEAALEAERAALPDVLQAASTQSKKGGGVCILSDKALAQAGDRGHKWDLPPSQDPVQSMRRRVVSLLNKALQTSSEPHVPANTQHIALEIEEALYGLYASEVCEGYIQQARMLKASFKSNALLRAAVLGRNTEVCVMALCCVARVPALGLEVCLCSCFPGMARRRVWL